MIARSEKEIMSKWNCDNTDNPLVSIICNTYNHEQFIGEALDSMLMQETDFPFEILVHDDASTDKTAEIILEYQEQFPKIIKPIIQKENQRSQHIPIGITFQYPRVKGKYVAKCEGDDYWSDSGKLQIQIDFLESHPDYSMCCHNSMRLYMDTGEFEAENPISAEGEASPEEMILEPNKTWVATASLVYPAKYLDRPDVFNKWPVGDLPQRLYCLSQGKVYYFEKPMSVYRRAIQGQYMERLHSDCNMQLDFDYRMMQKLKEFNEYTDGRYEKIVNRRRRKHKRKFNRLLIQYPLIKDTDFFRSRPFKFRARVYIQYRFPKMYDMYNGMKGKKQ